MGGGSRAVDGGGSSAAGRPTLVGRDGDIEAVAQLIDERVPVITVVATGGAGKTRLATAIAQGASATFGEHVHFVALSGVTDPRGVPAAIAGVLQVRASADRSIEDAVRDELRHRSTLLVLDNFEQILAAAPFVAQLVDQCPLLTVLVTSRAPLRIAVERVYELAPLPSDAPDSSAVVLFCERARVANPALRLSGENLREVMELCARLDGLPLAIELAASRLSVLTPAAMLERFDRSDASGLRLLSLGARDAPARHRTLEDTIAWSYDLLAPKAQQLLRSLSIFEAGATLGAIEAVSGDDAVIDHLNALVDLRLVVVEHGSEPRFRLLETIREFAILRRGVDGDVEHRTLLDRMCAYYLAVVDVAQQRLESRDDGRCIAELEADYLNLRVVFDALDRRGEIEAGLQMASALGWFWRHSGRGEEGRNRLKALHERLTSLRSQQSHPRPLCESIDPLVEANALIMIGRLSAEGGLIGEGRKGSDETIGYLEDGLALHRRCGDPVGLVRGLESVVVALVQHERGPRAGRLCDEALVLATEIGHAWWISMVLYSVVIIEQMNGHLDAALVAAERGRAVALADNDPRQATVGTLLIGTTHMFAYRTTDAEAALTRAYRESLVHGDKRSAAFAAVSLGPTNWATGEYQVSARWTRDALTLAQAVSEWRCIGLALTNVTYLAEFVGAHEASARFQGAMRSDVDSFYRAMPLVERENIDRLAKRTRRAIGDEAFDRAMTLGEQLPRNMAIEEAIVFAESVMSAELDLGSSGAEELSTTTAKRGSVDGLSAREIDVLVQLASGKTNRQIADALYLSQSTVERHLVNVYRKIGVRRRAEATTYAIRHQFVTVPAP